MTTFNPVYCALDLADLDKAQKLANGLAAHVGGFKLGLEFFLAHGADGYGRIATVGKPIFLDLKLHDIPNTVAGAVTSLLPLSPAFMTLHASGGTEMMRAARNAAAKSASPPKILGVTVLTSMDGKDLAELGLPPEPRAQVMRLGKLVAASGIDGIVCSPEEIAPLRAELGTDIILMVPGIRPAWAAANDQKRVMTPKEAMLAGANYLVIGRPITTAENPVDAAKRICDELA